MTEENKETFDAAVQDDASVSTDNNDTLNKDSEGKDFEKLYETQKARAEKAEGKLKDVKSSVSEEPVVKEEKEEVKQDYLVKRLSYLLKDLQKKKY